MQHRKIEELDDFMLEYMVYGANFLKQVSTPDVWQEQTGCSLDGSHKEYIKCCMERVFDFKTWFEHSYNEQFPSDWDFVVEYKFGKQVLDS